MPIPTPASIRRSFRLQLLLALGFLSLLSIAIAIVALQGLFALRTETRTSATDIKLSRLANEIGLQALLCRRYEKDFFLSAGNPSSQQAPVQQWHMASINLREAIKVFEEAATSDEDRKLAGDWRDTWREYVLGFGRVEIAISAGQIQSPQDAIDTFEPYQANIQSLTDQAVATAQRKGASAEQASSNLENSSTRAGTGVALIAAFGVLISIAGSLLFPSWLIRPINALNDAALRLSRGDLSARVGLRREDELGALAQRFDEMADTIQRNTSDLQAQYDTAAAARAAAEEAHAKIAEQLGLIEAQQAQISEMSVPILPLTNSTLVMPLVGTLDSARLLQAQERALGSIQDMRARHLILDITGVPIVDTLVARGFLQIVQATQLLGCRVVLVGIRPEVAQTLVSLGIDLRGITTAGTLQSGVAYTLNQPEQRNGRAAVRTSTPFIHEEAF